MADGQLSLLAGVPPSTFRLGTVVLVEYESHAPWFETSITLAANALRAGVPMDYHTFQHVPEDVVAALMRQGVDARGAQGQGRFRIIDSYSAQTGLAAPTVHRPYEFASQSMRISDWKRGSSRVLEDPGERGLVHIDENDSVLLQYNREPEVLDFFRTRAFEAARKRDFLFVHGFVAGLHSKRFYRTFESLADVVLDLRTREVGGHLEPILRLRALRGMGADSRWRLLAVTARGEVRVLGPAPLRVPGRRPGRRIPPATDARHPDEADFRFRNRNAGKVFDTLVEAFVEDSRTARMPDSDAGWRSLVRIAHDTGLAPSSLYPRQGAVNPIMGELASQGLVESRVIPGARGRGGISLRVRVACDHGPVRAYLRQRGAR